MFREITKATVAFALAAGVVAPGVLYAQIGAQPPSKECVASDAAHTRVLGNIDRVKNRIELRSNELTQMMSARRQDLRVKIGKSRDRWLEVRDGAVNEILSAESVPEGLRDAAEKFRADTDAARADREIAVDAAEEKFHTELNAARASISDEILASIETFRDEVDAAFLAAQDRCETGIENAANTGALHADLNAARVKFRDARKGYDIKVNAGPIISTMKQEIETAKNLFVSRMRDSQTELEAAWRVWRAADGPVGGVEPTEPVNVDDSANE